MHKNNDENGDHTTVGATGPSLASAAPDYFESRVAALWKEFLGLPANFPIGIDENFFDVGGTSLLATRLLKRLNEQFQRQFPIAVFFEFATIRAFAGCLRGELKPPFPLKETAPAAARKTRSSDSANAIAIIGMTGRFPGADTVEEFWKNLLAGTESVTFFENGQLDPQEQLTASRNENYVAARPLLSTPDYFDADFFGIYPKEAAQMDPQHRILLECAWEVLERAGYDPAHTTGSVGVFAGCSMNTYFLRNLADQRSFVEEFTGNYQVGNYSAMMGNDKDFLPTRISYKLNLRGPSLSIQTACSTSLVAVAQACQSLQTGGCEMALAGAVSVTFPLHRGYLSVEGGLASLDGHCRPFDEKASGTVFGHGAGIVLLKRLEDAEADGDQILAVIRGFAVNNDGSAKAGYTAPSVEGQTEVIARAQQMAGIPAESVSYVEAHGTGTPLGDPIEVAALTRAFRQTTQKRNFCSLGTAKGNVGHLDVAAGATGLIKTILQIEHKTIPALLHYRSPNPHLQLDDSPFLVDERNREWTGDGKPLLAGVSAFGVGGTNAHLVLEEPPEQRPSDSGRNEQLILISAKTRSAFDKAEQALAKHFEEDTESQTQLGFADAAFTLQKGRSSFALRRAIVASNAKEAALLLGSSNPPKPQRVLDKPQVVFCFPGQGVQSVGMGRQLYKTEVVFRESFDHCDSLFTSLLGKSLRSIIFADAGSEAAAEINQTFFAQPAIFAYEYSLARLWQSWGIHPSAMLGHSVGEYVAACLSGVLTLDETVQLLAARSRLMQSLPKGAMLAVRASEERVTTLLRERASTLDLAAVNSPQLCVVSGEEDSIQSFMNQLDDEKVAHRRLITSHGFHSRMLDPILEEFARHASTLEFRPPAIPYVSSLTGDWIDSSEVCSPAYWVNHLRQTVRFSKAVTTAAAMSEVILLEVGPSETLVQLMRQSAGPGQEALLILASQGALKESIPGHRALHSALGRLWVAGVQPDWEAYHRGSRRRRRLLPTYQFDRKRYWIEPALNPVSAGDDRNRASTSTLESLSPISNPSGSIPSTLSLSSQSTEDRFMPASTQVSSMLDDLKALVTDLSGTDLADAEPDASFLELGFDSLFLTQLTQGIQSKYKIKLTFRQIMEEYPTLNALASHITATAAPAPAAVPPAAPPPAPSSQPVATAAAAKLSPAPPQASATSSGYEALFASQVQALSTLFQQQLSLLHGQIAEAPLAPAPLKAPPAPVSIPSAAPISPDAGTVTKPAKPAFTPFKPLQKGETGGLNSVQEAYLQGFIDTYNRKTGKSKQFTQDHRSVFADGRVVSGFNAQLKELIYPIVVERAKGAYLWDKDGNRYIDILNGYGAILYGHSPDFIVNALRDQLELGFAIGPQTDLVGECSELIREFTGLERVTFCNTGSEAVMGAMRLARTVTGRNLIVLFSGDYHGSFDEVLVKSVGNQRSMPVAPGIPRESVANILVLEYGADEALRVIRERADEIAAVLVEPVQSRHPELRPEAFLREVRSITEQSGSALIFDEVVTGFRTHLGGMQALYGIKADLATYGKVVAGGMPMGVLAGSSTFMDALDGGSWRFGDESFPQVGVTFYAGTFMRHPLAMAAVRASLLHLKAAGPELQRSVAAKTSALVADLNQMLEEFSYPSQLETFSSWFYFAIPTDPKLARMLHFHLREEGIHIQEGFPCFLTTAHTDADLLEVRAAFRKGLERMRAGQVLPTATSEKASEAASLSPVPATRFAPIEISKPAARYFPITEQQREIFLGTQLGPEANCAFNESTSLDLKGSLDLTALESALNTLVSRHESLRSTIDASGEVVHVSADLTVPFTLEDLSLLSESEMQRRRAEILREEASLPFDLISGPLFRARILKFSGQNHTLVFTAHHIIFDGWSTNVLFRELAELYNASVRSVPANLPAAFPFSAYAEQQKRSSGSEEHGKVERFWLDQFQTLPNALQIPTDRPRPQLRENSGATLRFVFPGETLKAIRKAGAKQGSTLFSTLLSSFALLIHRLSQQEDVVIGIPVAGQAQLAEGSNLVGHGVNFLPVRSHLQSGQSLVQFLKQTRKTLLDAQDNQDYTYGTLLRALKIASDPSRLQLVEVQFNVEQVGSGLQMDGLSVDLSANPKSHVNMDLFFNFVDRGSELWLDVDYNTGLFEADTIARWFGHLNAILDAFVLDAEQAADQVSLLNASQLSEILEAWNATEVPFDREKPVHRVFEAQVDRTPDAIALVGENATMTYAELNERSNQLARFLQKAGVGQGDRIAVSLHRSMELIVSLIAILKAGAAYVPVDPGYPAPRLSFLVRDSGAKLLLTQRSIASQLPADLPNLLLLDQEWPVIALESPQNLEEIATPGPDRLAYVMYTSGSTGNPKGVLVPGRAILRLVQNNSFASFSSHEVFLQLAPISFDAATFEIWGALLNGARLVMGPVDRVTPEEIGRLIAAHDVTTVWLTAALFHLVVTEHLEILRPLRQLLAGGDVLSVAHCRTVCQQMPHIRLINGYGPTENTTFTCCHTVSLESLEGGSVPIGKAIANTRVYLLDAYRKPVPPGVTGELYTAGEGLAIGYLHAPELTEEKFVELTIETAPGKSRTERLYRTGDLARFRSRKADGTIEFLGRADTQVKIRGYRIELAEIENALERSPLVRSAVVAVRTDWVSAYDAPGDKRLAAYVIAAAPGDSNPGLVAELRKHLQEQLPDYMQPAAIMQVQSFPRTINGKVDRRALPAPVPEQLMRARSIVYPRTPLQETLASIWSGVLGVKEVSIDDTIFELGGDSLLIFRITTLANQAGLRLTARQVFQHKTVAAICEQLEQETNSQAPQGDTATIKAIPRSLHRRPQTTLK